MEHDQNIETLLHHVDLSRCSDEMVTLSEDSRELEIYIAGYAAKKLKDCCNGLFTGDYHGDKNPDFSYIQILSRGGLKIPSTNLVNYVCTVFAILEFVDDLITKSGLPVRKSGLPVRKACLPVREACLPVRKSGLPVRKATEYVLIHCFQSFETFACTAHEAIARKITNSTAVNIYFNNKRKTCTDSVAAHGVKTFKKREREKKSS